MKIHAMLIWYDEKPEHLAACVAGLTRIADHIVAVDGAYFRYPNGRPSSGGNQANIIHTTATSAGTACTIHTPQTCWLGDEIEKRNTTLRLAQAAATPYKDWLLTIDADETITEASELIRYDLEHTDLHAADIMFHTTVGNPLDWSGQTRRLYRNLPDLTYTATHYTMTATDPDTGQLVFINGRGPTHNEPTVDALNLTAQVKAQHLHSLRTTDRNHAADVFATQRHITEPWPQHA